jgi:hypothetical protein
MRLRKRFWDGHAAGMTARARRRPETSTSRTSTCRTLPERARWAAWGSGTLPIAFRRLQFMVERGAYGL